MEKWETIEKGPFEPTWESLRQYECPDWFKDAKLGSGLIGVHSRYRCTVTGTPGICTFKAAINIIITGGYMASHPNMDGKM